MDANVQVALIEKAKRIFAIDDGLFLSFPVLTPVAYQPATLAALLTPNSASDYAAAADFARIVNFVPLDQVANLAGGPALWDIYGEVLAHAEVATGRNDPVAHARSAEAQALLYHVNADGTRHESSAYLAYRTYRDAWFAAQQNYNAQRITSELSADPAQQKHWHDVLEVQLRSVVDQALADWQTLGRRSDIEAALASEITDAANDAGARWAQWQASFNPDIDLLTAGDARYAPTGYSPADLAAAGSWLSTSMSAAEIDALVASAPAELRVDTSGTVEQLSFEYRSVSVTRPWFDPAALTSRIWRSSDPGQVLSDGASPAQGRLPAYVVALVLIRHVAVKRKAQLAVADGPLRFTLAATALSRRRMAAQPMAATSAAVAAETMADDTISVLAFICKQLPKAPDPFPGLLWSAAVAPPDAIDGDWVDTDGFTYKFSQSGSRVTYLQLQNNAQVGAGAGEFDGVKLSYTYQTASDAGQCSGQLAPDGKRIDGTCSSGGQNWPFSITRAR